MRAVLLLLLAAALSAQGLPSDLRARLDALDAAPAPRGAARAAVHAVTLGLGRPGVAEGESRAWFAEVRRRAAAAADPELKAFLEAELGLDPGAAVPLAALRLPDPVPTVAYARGAGALAAVVDAQRSLELGARPVMTVAELAATARRVDEPALASRALKALRRMDAAAATPLLWQRLGASQRRSEVLEWEDELRRVPVAALAVGFPARPADAWGKPARAAWLRLLAGRPGMGADKAAVAGFLRGPADELTEAAWDAVPDVFGAADRAQLESAAQGVSERLAPRARDALARLR